MPSLWHPSPSTGFSQYRLQKRNWPHTARALTFRELSKAQAKGPKNPPPPSLFTASVAASVAPCTALAPLTTAALAASAAADAAFDTAPDGSASADDEATSPSVSRLVVSRADRWSSAEGELPALSAVSLYFTRQG